MPTPSQRRVPGPELVDYSVDPLQVPVAREIFGEDRLSLFKQQIARGWKRLPTDAELEQMALVYQRLRYDPWARPPQLIFMLRWDSNAGGMVMTPAKTIDGLRLDASRSRDYQGQIGPQWCGEDGIWKDIWLRQEPPAAARVGVLRRGFDKPLWSVALWREWVQLTDEYVNNVKTGKKVPTSFWLDKPAHMIAKTAEAMSLRRALPSETDPGELQHVQQMERLALSANTATHERVFGTNEHTTQDLPLGPSSQFVPKYVAIADRTDVQDAPRALPSAPPSGKRERPIGELYAEYGALLTQARHAGAITEGELSKWMLPQGAERVLVVERGVALRAALNRATIDRSNVNMAAQAAAQSEYDEDAHEPDFSSELIGEDSALDEGEDIATLTTMATDADGLTVHTVHDNEYQRLVAAIHAASQADLDFDDCKVELPCAVTEIVRKRQVLEGRLEAVKVAMAANPPPRAPAAR